MNRNTKKSAPPPRRAVAQVKEVRPVKAVQRDSLKITEAALPAALTELGAILIDIENQQNELHNRLYTVLDHPGPSDGEAMDECGSEASIQPKLTSVVYRLSNRLREVRDQQRDIIDRLHI